jgi:diguanylate cyclase (GGDEF)-like protein
MTEERQKPTILLVAASANSSKLVARHLEAFFTVLTAMDAESAWETLLKHRDITLVISELDLMIDRFGLLERMRNASDSWLAATPILLLVGENDTDAGRELAFQMGATDFINLPFATSELTARARLHANLYVQHAQKPVEDMQEVSAANLLQQLSQQNFFNSRAQQELSFSQRHRSNISICKLALDNIKAIVAGFDKATAITAVKAVAKIMQQTLRREDSLCYLGNAEFYLLYPATNGIGATAGVNRIFKHLSSSRIRIAGKQVPVTLSGAVYSCVASESIDLEHIYRQLDTSLKTARAEGGNRVVGNTSSADKLVYSIDRALKLIETSNTEDLAGHAVPLVLTVLPLLEFADEVLELGLESVNQKLRQQLEMEARSEAV